MVGDQRIREIKEVILRRLANVLTPDQARAAAEEISALIDLELASVNRELETLAYAVSHDLRAPLRSLSGYSKIVEEDYSERLDEEGKRLLGVIQQNAIRMNLFIDELQKYSRLNKKEIQPLEIEMTDLVRSVLTAIPHQAEIILSPMPTIVGDHDLIAQVWSHLVSNAIKYSSKTENPRVEIGSDRTLNEIVYYVRDNGVGFDMQYVDKLFGVFQRLHKPSDFEGVGVGLATVLRIITRHGGRVWAEGKVNGGATFYFALPVTAFDPSDDEEGDIQANG